MSYDNKTKSGRLWLTTIPMLCFSCAETSSTASSSTRFMNGSKPLSTPVTCRLPFSFTERNQGYCYILHYLDPHFNDYILQGLPRQGHFHPKLAKQLHLAHVSILLGIVLGFFSISFVLKEVAMKWKMVLGHLKVKSLDTLLISLNFKVVLGTGLVFNCSALRDYCSGELLLSFWNSQQTVQSTLLNNLGNSRFWTISPGLQVKSWNLPDNHWRFDFPTIIFQLFWNV